MIRILIPLILGCARDTTTSKGPAAAHDTADTGDMGDTGDSGDPLDSADSADSADTADSGEPADSGDTGEPAESVIGPCVREGTTGIPTHGAHDSDDMQVICQPADEVWSLMVIPDSQVAVAWDDGTFDAQTAYIRSMYTNDANNTVFVAHVGDLVDNPVSESQWTTARSAMDSLATFEYSGVRHFIPYDIAWGDHDLLSYSDADDDWPASFSDVRDKHADYISGDESTSSVHGFGVERYKAAHEAGGVEYWQSWFVGYDYRDDARYGSNSYHFFDAGGDPYLALFLEFCPSEDVLDWAAQRLEWFAAGPRDRRVVLVMHSFLTTHGGLKDYKWLNRNVGGTDYDWVPACWEFNGIADNTGSPSDVFERLIEPYNVHMVLSGHDNNSAWKGGTYARFTVPEGVSGTGEERDVHAFLANYQHIGTADGTITKGGLGYLRVMRFYPNEDAVEVTTWSPYSYNENDGAWNADDSSGEPLNWRGDADESFNESTVCSAFSTETGDWGDHPGQCETYTTVDGLCDDLEGEIEAWTVAHEGAPYESFVARCNQLRVGFEMTGG